MKKNNTIFWLIGFFFPIIGIILYFVYKNKDESKSSKSIKGVITGFILALITGGLILLIIAARPKSDVEKWNRDIESGKTVLTVIGASYCNHCQELKPVITKIAAENDILLYFFEIDKLDENEGNTLTTTYELDGYNGSVPYMFIMKNKQFVSYDVGFRSESITRQFLWENGLIKN